MADNTTVKDALNATKTFDTEDIGGGVQRTRVRVAAITAGASADIGSTTDAAVTGDNSGSLSGKMRGLLKRWGLDIPAGVGQKAKAGSLSVALASDDDLVAIFNGLHSLGAVKDNGIFWTAADQTTTSADMSGADANITPAPTSGYTQQIDDLIISAAADMKVTIKEETLGARFDVYLKASQPFTFSPRNGLKATAANRRFTARASAAGNISIFASYHENA